MFFFGMLIGAWLGAFTMFFAIALCRLSITCSSDGPDHAYIASAKAPYRNMEVVE
jgi:hypothetical protein